MRADHAEERPADPTLTGIGLSIGEAERFLGVPGPTLRSWERRYGLATATRSTGGHRRYQSVELVQLGLMRDEIASGRRAGDAARWVLGILDEANPQIVRVRAMLAGSRALDRGAIRAVLVAAYAEIGLVVTLDEVVVPAMRQIGVWWETGRCDVGPEQVATAVVRGWLAELVTLAPAPLAGRTVLLATGPEDFHTLGLEALAAALAQLRVGTRLLGARTSPAVLVAAVLGTADAVVVLVAHLVSRRRSATASLEALAERGVPAYFAGNAFRFPSSRRGVPGTYLGERVGAAALVVAAPAS